MTHEYINTWITKLVHDCSFDLLAEPGAEICQGDKCLVIKENMSKNNYCMECAVLILRKAQEELALLIKEGEIA